ncbi:MAG TPA: hypothetical protein DCS93_02030 [Microscillaceae bacterium]|nr:hypothetical protein [Microscillaceae bacterium]
MTDQEKEIQKLKARVFELENIQPSLSTNQKAKTDRQEKLFLVMFITFLASIPTLLVLRYIENQIERAIILIVILILIVFLISFFIIKHKEQILNFIFTTTKTQVEDVLEPVPKVIEAYENKDFKVVKKEGMEFFKMAYAKYSWVKIRLFILNTTMALFLGFGALLGVFLIFKQNELIVTQNEKIGIQNNLLNAQNRQVEAQTQLAESNRRSSLVFLMSNIMDKVDAEIKADCTYQRAYRVNPDTSYKAKLSKTLEGRIIALSRSLKPYRYLEGNSIRKTLHSPEREQLLTSIIQSNVNIKQITKNGDFAYAQNLESTTSFDLWKPEKNKDTVNLKGVNLQEAYLIRVDLSNKVLDNVNLKGSYLNWANLKGIDLISANLTNTNLRWVNLIGANLTNANLREANLIEANLRRANLTKANLNEASLIEAGLIRANLSGANLSAAKLIEADLSEANLKKTKLGWTDLNGADLRRTNLKGTDLSYANLTQANLNEADIDGANFSGASLRGAVLPQAEKFKQAAFSVNTKLHGAFTADPDWLKNIDKYIRKKVMFPCDLKKYEQLKLSNEEIIKWCKKNKLSIGWDILRNYKSLYQIRLKPGYKEYYFN